MDYLVQYDKTNPLSIEKYAQRMIGKTFREILEEDELTPQGYAADDPGLYIVDGGKNYKRNKGNLGQLIEERFFHYSCNSEARADFPEAGVELKVTPYRKNSSGDLSAKERLILTMIDYYKVINESFEESHLWKKSKLILLVYYLYCKDIRSNLDYRINYARLFTPPPQDVEIIKQDFEKIAAKVRAGKAHELSEADTMYLGAATKSATSKNRREQPCSPIKAKPRAFSFKSSYMTYVLNNYIVKGKATYQPIVTGHVDSFEEHVISLLSKHRGQSIEDLCREYDVDAAKAPKNLMALLTYRMLGIVGNHAEEFVKANIVVKTIRIGKNNRIKESMSFPNFKFKELVEEEWEDSTFGNYLRETRFLFVVFKFDNNDVLRLRGCQFWNIPYNDLETDVKSVWEKTKSVILDGVRFTVVNGTRVNNLPKASENWVCHVRPHGRNAKDTYELPDGRQFPKQCFWLNNTYIYEQLNDELK